MNCFQIGIIDSGIGGKGIEKEIRILIPSAELIYFADTKNFPYGTKSVRKLNQILAENTQKLIDQGIGLIVLACNSATVSSIRYLRKKFNIPIVGVEPAIKTAAEATKTKSIAVFSTPITSKSDATNYLIEKYCQDLTVYKIPFTHLASQIERGETSAYTSEVYAVWQKYKDENIDTIVLGCTHYTLIKSEIQKIVGKGAKLVDSNLAVAKQVKKIYEGLSQTNIG